MVIKKWVQNLTRRDYRQTGLILLAVMCICSSLSIFLTNSVSAITDDQKRHCISKYTTGVIISSKDSNGKITDKTNGDFNNNSCGEICTTVNNVINTPSGSIYNTKIAKCDSTSTGGGGIGVGEVKPPVQGATTLGEGIYNSYNQIVLDKYCPSTLSGDALATCIGKVNDTSSKCIPRNATSAAINFKSVSDCLQAKSPDSPKITSSEIEPLLKSGQSKAQADGDSAVAQSKCAEDANSTWDATANSGNGSCISDTENNGKPACNVDGVGWIVCPVLNFMAKITDQAYYVVSSMLQVRAFTTDDKDTKGALFSAWSAFRNIANVSFVFAFLVIIYSQLTSVGISNYGLKKLLPKLIIAAVLVNLSYWICMIAVDLSNFAGWALKSFFAGDGLFKITQPSSDTSSTGGAVGMASLTGSLLILGGVALYVGLTALLPVLITSLIAIVTVFLVLMMRQALIILLIVISPLAFVAYLLPNTESWFSKWRKLFTTLLLMYPIIGVIFGASALASKIVMASAPTGSGDETGIKIAIQIMGAGISMVPLFLTPIIMKTSGSVLGKFGGMINNPNKGPFDRMRKGANRLRENQEGKRSIRALNGGFVLPGTRGKYQRHAKKEAIAAGIKREQQYTQQQYVASQIAGGNTRFTNQVAGGSMGRFSPDASTEAIARALSSAEFTINEAEAKEVSAAQIRFENQGITSNTAFAELNSPNISNYSETERKALRQMVVQAGNADHIASLWDSLQSGNQTENLSERTSFAQQVEKNKPVGIGMGAIAQMKSATGTNQTFEQALADGIVAGRFDASGAARADNSELDMVASVAQNATLMADAVNRFNTSNPTRTTTSADVVTKLKDDARTARTDSRYNAGKARSSLQTIENIP